MKLKLLFFLLISVPIGLLAQVQITGTVTSADDGISLPGASVIVVGTTKGTTTDFDGNYSLENVPADAILRFSFLGFIEQNIAVNQQNTINVQLIADQQQLDEVVVIGYGTVKKSDLTGSVAQISNDDFTSGAISSADQAIAGRVAGVDIRQTSAEPGGGISVRIRGASSVTAGNEPLYVIDGLPVDNDPTLSTGGGAGTGANPNPKNPLNSLNPSDIESIEILKDASATAIYGSRGANGVVLITTKTGTAGKMSINFDHYTGVQSVAQKYDILDTGEYIQTINELSIESGNETVFSSEDISRIGNGTDWQDEIFRTAVVQNYNLSLSGGSEIITYYISTNYFNQEGIVKNSGLERYTLNTSLGSQVTDRLKINLNLNTSLVKDQAAILGTASNENSGAIYSAAFFDPTEPIFDENGDYFISSNLLLPNPVSIYAGIDNRLRTNRTFGSLSFDYQLTNDISAKLNLGADLQEVRRDVYNSKLTFQGQANNGLAQISSLERSNYLAEYTMNYSKSFNDNHFLDILGGVTYQDFQDRFFSAAVSDFTTDLLLTDNLSFGNPDQAVVNSNRDGYTLLSYLGRINYNLFNKFLFTGAFRADGSSRFGENNKFGYFPSVALAWKVHEEDFFPEAFNEFKIRTSWGITGNQSISNYGSLSTFVPAGAAVFNGGPANAAVPSRLSNPDLKWESTEQFNVGFDAGLWNNRLSGSFDFFHKKTSDMLLFVPQPLSSGYSNFLQNIGSMKNYGVEILLNTKNIITDNFQWTTSFNVTAIKNEVLDIGEDIDRILTGQVPEASENGTIITPGEPLNSYYGFNITGIFQNQSEIDNSAQPDSQPGFPIFEDINGDGQINNEDRKILGNPFPDFSFGFSNTLKYKNISLDLQFNGQYGNELLNATELGYMYPSNFRRNRSSQQINDRWTPNNPGARWPSGTEPTAYGGGKVSNLVVSDASFLRLQTIRLAYDWPTDSYDFLKGLNVYVTGQNLFTWTDYSGINPEGNVFGRSNARIDFMSYPLATTLILGLNITF